MQVLPLVLVDVRLGLSGARCRRTHLRAREVFPVPAPPTWKQFAETIGFDEKTLFPREERLECLQVKR